MKTEKKKIEKELPVTNIYQLIYNLAVNHYGKLILLLIVLAIIILIVVPGWQVKEGDTIIKKQPILKKELSPIDQKKRK